MRLLDRSTVNFGRFGADVISGGAGSDVAFGQDGADLVTGGAEDDTIEGNGGPDQAYGDRAPESAQTPVALSAGAQQWVTAGLVSPIAERDGVSTAAGEDDIVGGSNVVHRDVNDRVEGDGEDDFILGDNGTLRRQISGSSYVNAPGDGAAHVRIFRQATRLGVNSGSGVSGGDILWGNDGDDAIWGQEGNDDIRRTAAATTTCSVSSATTSSTAGWVRTRWSVTAVRSGTRRWAMPVPCSPRHRASRATTGRRSSADPVKYFTTGRYDRRVDLKLERPGAVGGPFPDAANIDDRLRRCQHRRPRHDAGRTGSRLDARRRQRRPDQR